MKISVVIPTYNSAAFIEITIESVLHQTVMPDEILIMDDGSTDNTVSILEKYKSQITVFKQQNKGVADARNRLCELAQGELIAFLDHDDIWHCNYLEVQLKIFLEHHNSVCFFTGHINFSSYGDYDWNSNPLENIDDIQVISPTQFIKQYNQTTGKFASMSYCCIPKKVLREIGDNPFCVSGADDFYLFNLLPIYGSIVYFSRPLCAYRMIPGAQSDNLLKSLELALNAFELLQEKYIAVQNRNLSKSIGVAFASKRRYYVKILMGVGRISEARNQLLLALKNCKYPLSFAKSLALYITITLPSQFQPSWPSSYRESCFSEAIEKENEKLVTKSFEE